VTFTADREQTIRATIADRRDELTGLVSALVQQQSTLGHEEGAQRLIADRLASAGFTIERIEPDAKAALVDPYAGYPPLSYDGRSSVVGIHRGLGGGQSLQLSGHIDVVPIDDADPWVHDPWKGVLSEGKIWGRGAGDMKGGLAAYLIAAEVVAQSCPDLRGDLVFSSVIEEECTGNGMWSVLHAGHGTDATLIGEPTNLDLIHAGTGVVWARLAARGRSGHSAYTGGDGPFDELARAIAGLRALEAAANRPPLDAAFAAVSDWPYGMTVGKIGGGVWTSSQPALLEARVRFGFGLDVDPLDIQTQIIEAVATAAPAVEVSFEAFRARAYCHDREGALPELLSEVHASVLHTEMGTSAFTATTDARYVDGPCACYGPVASGFHGADEWVDIESLESVATVVALTAARWLA